MKLSKKIVLNHSELKKIINLAKKNRKKIVFTNGCFDILHPGHTRYLAEAKALGDKLLVAVNSDSSIKKIKGDSRPIQTEDARTEILAALEAVDFITLFKDETPLELIKLIQPDILVKGGDWKIENIVGSEVVKANGGKVFSIPITYKCSTTNLVDKIKDTTTN